MTRNRSRSRARQRPPNRLCRFRCTGASRRQLQRTVQRQRLLRCIVQRRLLSLRLTRASRNQAIILRRLNLLAAGQGTIHPAAALLVEARTRAEALPAAVAEAVAEAVVRTVVAVVAAAAISEAAFRRPRPK
jgi:hypothetical protein